MRWVALALAALALTGCETTAEKSAKLERAAKQQALRDGGHSLAHALTIAHQSTSVTVTSTTVLAGSEGAAAVVSLHNLSAKTLHAIPIEIDVRDSSGATVYTNSTPGLATALVSVALLPAHGTTTWIDDQVQPSGGTPASVTAKVGEGLTSTGPTPDLSVVASHLSGDAAEGSSIEGSVVNHSAVTQRELVVYGLAMRAGKVVAAGRALLPQAPAGASTHFQIYFVGNLRGAGISFQAPPTTLG